MSIRSAVYRLFSMTGWIVLSPVLTGLLLAQDAVSVRGTVTLPDGTPASGAAVQLRDTSRVVVTDADGAFVFDAVARGRYEIEAALAGYTTVTAVVDVPNAAAPLVLRLGPVTLEESVDVFGIAARGDTNLDRLPGPILGTPFSITVVPQARIELQKAQSLNEALRYTPGVQSEQYGGLDQAFDFMTIRGFGGSSFNGLFRDGVRLYTFGFVGFRTEPYGAESIEVLRGATSVLYGPASPGGIINLTSKRPTAAPLHEVTVEVGNFEHVQGKFDFGGPLGNASNWRYRLTGVARNSSTQVDFLPNDRVFVAPALSWTRGGTTLTALGHYQQDQTQHFQFLPQIGTAEPTVHGQIPESRADGEPDFDNFDRRQGSAGYLLEQQFGGGWSLRQQTRYDHVQVDYSDVYGLGLDPADASQRTLSRAAYTVVGNTDVVTLDGQLQRTLSHGPVRHTLVLGGDYQRSIFEETDSFGDAPPLDVYAPVYGSPVVRPAPFYDVRTSRDQAGLFVSDRIHFENGIAATLSGRQNFVYDDVENHLADSTTDEDDSKFVWQGGLAFVNRAGIVPHVSYSESFLPVSGADFTGQRYQPETGQQVEAGLRYQPPAYAGSMGFAFFDLRRQNVLTPDPTNPLNQIQTGEVRSRGIELEADANLDAGLSLTASYTFQDVEITKSNAGDLGLRPSVIPEHMWSVWAHHAVRSGTLRGLGAGIGLRYQGATLDSTNTFELDGFTLVDAVGSYSVQRLRFAVNVQNLLDKEYLGGCSGGTCYWGRSLTVYGSTTYAW